MLSAAYGPLSAAPLVSLTLEHISRTPLARLGIVYQIVPAYVITEPPYAYATEPWEEPAAVGDWFERPLGVNIYIDSLLSGGIDGQPLTMPITVTVPAAPGATINVLG